VAHAGLQTASDLQLPELASRDRRDVRESFDRPALRERFGVDALERPDHDQ
jgi:hypothetical protein